MNFKDIFKITKAIKQSKEAEKKFRYYFKHIPNFIKLYWRLFKDKRVPFRLKAMLIGSILYLLTPIDFIPELFTLLFGLIDDAVIMVLAFRYFIKWSPKDVVKEKILEIDEENFQKELEKQGYSEDN